MENNFDFSYNIFNVNLEQGTIEIEYIPDDENLTPVRLNQYLLVRHPYEILDKEGVQIYQTMEEIPLEEHINYTVNTTAPLYQWRRQSVMLNNHDAIISSNGHVNCASLNINF